MAKQSQDLDGALYESVYGILSCEVPDEEKHRQLEELGITPTMLNAIHLAMGKKAAGGDVQAAKYLRDIAQETGTSETDNSAMEKFGDLTALSDQKLRELAAKWEE